MDIIYLKIKIPKSAKHCDDIREAGYFFEYISEAVGLPRKNVIEIDETNYKKVLEELKKRFD